jgi:hypothetical protein
MTPEDMLRVFHEARNGSDKPAGILRGIKAVMLVQKAESNSDSDRLDWLRDNLFTHSWNGVVGTGCAVQWQVAPDFRFKQRELSDNNGIMAGDFRRAIDNARGMNGPVQPQGNA